MSFENMNFNNLDEVVREAVEHVLNQQINLIIIPALQKYQIQNIEEISKYLDFEKYALEIAGLQDPIGQIKAFFTNTITSALSGFKDWIMKYIYNPLKDWFENNIYKPLKAWFKDNIYDPLKNFIERIYNVNLKDWFENSIYKPLKTWFENNVYKPLKRWFEDNIYNPLKEMITQGLPNWIRRNIYEPLKNWFENNIYNPLKNWFETHIYNPLKNAITQGLPSWFNKYIFTPLKNAISSIADTLKNAVAPVLKTIKKNVVNAIQNLGNIGKSLGSIGKKVLEIFKTVNEIPAKITNFAQTVQKIFTGVGENLTKIFSKVAELPTLLQSISKSILVNLSKFGSSISGFFQTIRQGLENIGKNISQFPKLLSKYVQSVVENVEKALAPVGKAIIEFGTTLSKFKDYLFETFNKVSEYISTAVTNAFENVKKFFEGIFSKIGSFFETLSVKFSEFGKTVSANFSQVFKAFDNIGNLFSGLQKNILNFFENVRKGFENLSKTFEPVKKFFEQIGKVLHENVVKPILDQWGAWTKEATNLLKGISSAFMGFSNMLGKIHEWLSTSFQNFIQGIQDFFSTVGEIFSKIKEEIINFFTKTLPKFFTEDIPKFFTKDLPSFFSDLGSKISSALQDLGKTIWERLPDWFKSGLQAIGDFFSRAGESIYNFFTKTVPKFFTEDIPKFFTKDLPSFFSDLGGKIREGLQNLGKWIWEHLPDWLKSGLQAVGDFFVKAGEQLYNFFTKTVPKFFLEDVPNFFTKTLPEAFRNFANWIKEGLQGVSEWFWGNIKGFVEAVQNFFRPLYEGFQKFIADPIGFFKDLFTRIKDAIWGIIPDPIKVFFENAKNFFGEFVKDPLSALWKYIGEPIWKGLQWLWQTIISYVSKASNWFTSLGKEFVSSFSSTISGVFSGFLNIFKAVGDAIKEAFEKVYSFFFESASASTKTYSQEVIKEISAGKVRGEFGIIGGFIIRALIPIAYLYAIPKGIERLADMIPAKHIDLRPLGIGVSIDLSLNEIVKFFTKIASHLTKVLTDATVLGFSFHFLEPFYKYALYLLGLRNVLPVTLPTLDEAKKIAQRYFASVESDRIVEQMREILKMRGYADVVVDYFIKQIPEAFTKYGDLIKRASEKTFYVTIKDRFETDRILPIPQVFDLPTHSELCRMMIKDIFNMPEDFVTAMTMRGMNPDIAMMYYLLHFKYPSPEKLIEFYTRSLAGFLVVKSKEIFPDEEPLISRLGIGESPVAPADLNFEGLTVWNALQKYFKWHDYFFANWFKKSTDKKYIPKFTSDRLIVLETAFDIPTRIDARWLWKWGIFSGLGVEKARSLAPTLLGKIPEEWARALTGESFDALMLSRINIARGMHPEWVPFITLAEMWNAYSEERTITRTGFINLFKEGFWTAKDITELMQGFFKLKFLVLKWVEERKAFTLEEVELPVKFLEGERKLLALRALMDRALDILRDAQKEAMYSAVENIIPIEKDKENYVSILEDLVGRVNETFFKKVMRDLFGVERELKLDRDYYNVYIEVIKRFKNIYTIRRLRYWLSRIMWNVYGRLMRGFVSKKEVEKVIDEIVNRAKLTDLEKDTLKFIADLITDVSKREHLARGILRKLSRMVIGKEEAISKLAELGISREEAEALVEEYVHVEVPTVSQVITISEVYPEAVKILDKIIELRGIPKEFAELWRKYAELKPVLDEVRRLVTATITAYANGVIEEGEFSSILNELRKYGYTDKEIEIIKKIGEVRKKIRELSGRRREYLPTPSQLATLSEIVPIPEKLVEQVLEARRVPDEWKPIWKQYVSIRPIIDEVRRFVTSLIRAYEENVFTAEEFTKELQELKKYGYTDEEIKIIYRLSEVRRRIEELREKRRELVPTPSQLATLSEVVAIPTHLIKEVFEKRRVPEEWRPIWETYITVRPVLDEVRRLVTTLIRAYEEEILLDKEFEKALELLKDYGYTSREIEIIKEIARIRKEIEIARLQRREYLPTPSQLASIAEVIAIPEELINYVFEKRRVPKEFRDLWKAYISIRPIVDEVRRLVTTLITAYQEEVINDKELEKFLETVKKYGYTDTEIEFIKTIATIRREIDKAREVRREMIPTPAQLSTIAEYVPIPNNLIEYVFERRRVPEEFRNIWRAYIKIRPLGDEVRRLVTYVLRAYEEGLFEEKEFIKALEELKPFGYTDDEIRIIKKIGDLRKGIEELRAYYPTPTMLATIAEYVPEALAYIEEVLKYRRIPEEWKAIWRKYILSRIVSDDVRRTLNYLITLYSLGGISRSKFEKEVAPLISQWYIPAERDLLFKYIDIRRHVEVLRRVVPNFVQLTYMYEYSTHALDVLMSRIDELLSEAPIPDESKKVLKELWKEVAKLRSVRRWRDMAIRELIYLYASGAVDDVFLDRELREFKKWGLRDEHIQFIKKSAQYRRIRYAYIYGRS